MSEQAFAFLLCGGCGRDSGRTIDQLYKSDGRPFPASCLYIDTEPGTVPWAEKLDIGLLPSDLEAIMADPQLFGPVVEAVCRHYPQFLTHDAICNGSRTMRVITHLCVEYRLDRIRERLYASIRKLFRESGCATIQPVFVGSTGGGAGSALMVLLAILFAEPAFRSLISSGLSPYLLNLPVAVVAEPFAFAIKHKLKHQSKILANAYAFRVETALPAVQKCFQYVFSQGLANDGGAVLDTDVEISKSLGTCVYQLARHWPYAKARFVDTVDTAKTTDRYHGHDIPELRLDAGLRPPFASQVTAQRRLYRIHTVKGPWNGQKEEQP